MKSLTYDEETKTNEQVFNDLTRQIRPDIWEIMESLDKNKINSYLILDVIRELIKVNQGTGWGDIKVEITNRVATRIFSSQHEKIDIPLTIT
jgi:hypothetical protein